MDPTGHIEDGPGLDLIDDNNTVTTYTTDEIQEKRQPDENLDVFRASDYRSLSIYLGEFGSLLVLLIAQLEPTPITEFGALISGKIISGGVTITWDNYGRIYISPGGSIGKTLISDPAPSVSFTWGYVETDSPGFATADEVDNLLSNLGRSHGFCGPLFPCINYTTNIENTARAIEWGFGIPNMNFGSIFYGFGPWQKK